MYAYTAIYGEYDTMAFGDAKASVAAITSVKVIGNGIEMESDFGTTTLYPPWTPTGLDTEGYPRNAVRLCTIDVYLKV